MILRINPKGNTTPVLACLDGFVLTGEVDILNHPNLFNFSDAISAVFSGLKYDEIELIENTTGINFETIEPINAHFFNMKGEINFFTSGAKIGIYNAPILSQGTPFKKLVNHTLKANENIGLVQMTLKISKLFGNNTHQVRYKKNNQIVTVGTLINGALENTMNLNINQNDVLEFNAYFPQQQEFDFELIINKL